MPNTRPAYLLGMPRNGTSLLRAVLHKHPSVAITVKGDVGFFEGVYERFGDVSTDASFQAVLDRFLSRNRKVQVILEDTGMSASAVRRRALRKDRSYRAIIEALLEEYQATMGKHRWGYKSPGKPESLGAFRSCFPDSQVILIVRDPRDSYISMKHAPFRKDAGSLDVHAYAAQWHSCYGTWLKTLLAQGDFLVYRHEDMVTEPEAALRRVAAFLDEPYHENCLNLDDVKWEQNTSFQRGRSRFDTATIGRWHKQCSSHEVAVIEDTCHELMDMFGYPRSRQVADRTGVLDSMSRALSKVVALWRTAGHERPRPTKKSAA